MRKPYTSIDPFQFEPDPGDLCTRWHLMWLGFGVWTVTAVVYQVKGMEVAAMWAALALAAFTGSIVVCVKLSQVHEMALLKAKYDHEITKMSIGGGS